jgi:hypothetical protein
MYTYFNAQNIYLINLLVTQIWYTQKGISEIYIELNKFPRPLHGAGG